MYELPNELKSLYKHWDKHTQFTSNSSYYFKDSKLESELKYFIKERINIWIKKDLLKLDLPYTEDKILQTYKFCNIFREFDRQTIFFHKFLKDIESNFELWLMNMFVCRMIANIETISKLGILTFENQDEYYEKFMKLSKPKFGNAYVFPISTIQKIEENTRERFICYYLPKRIKEVSKIIQSWNYMSVASGIEMICDKFGINLKFLWTEVLIDVAYQYPEKVNLFDTFPIGPGSAPTMKQIDKSKDLMKTNLALINYKFKTDISYNGKEIALSAENWEGIGCEFRKYQNLKKGIGRKRYYK